MRRSPTTRRSLFSHPAGGALCARCGTLARTGRTLPAVGARRASRLARRRHRTASLDALEARAHQRLLREFLREHLADDRPLRAFEVWEQQRW